MKSRHVIGVLVVTAALAQTGCAALGIATLGMASPKPVETASLPDGPLSGAPIQPGNGNVSFTVNLLNPPGFNTQYVLSEVTRLVIGLIDLNASETAYFGYEGTTRMTSDPTYHAAIAGTVSGGSHTPGLLDLSSTSLSNTEKVNRNRYLYYSLTSGITTTTTRTITFTNVKPGNSRYVAFAAAFVGSTSSSTPTPAGFTQSAAFTTTGNMAGNQANTAPAITLTLNRGLGSVSGTTTIVEAAPAAQ